MKSVLYKYVSVVFLLFLQGCTFVEWGNVTFRQAEKISDQYAKSMRPFIKSVAIYNEFVSIAEFSALFLTDQARMIYADYFFHRNFKTPEEQEISRQRLLQENEHYITFYILGYQPAVIYPYNRSMFSGEYQVQGPLLGAVDASWKVTLLVDGKEYLPYDIRSVDLASEYQHFFALAWSQFKFAYKVRFDYFDEQGEPIVSKGPHRIVLNFSSVVYDAKLDWQNITYHM